MDTILDDRAKGCRLPAAWPRPSGRRPHGALLSLDSTCSHAIAGLYAHGGYIGVSIFFRCLHEHMVTQPNLMRSGHVHNLRVDHSSGKALGDTTGPRSRGFSNSPEQAHRPWAQVAHRAKRQRGRCSQKQARVCFAALICMGGCVTWDEDEMHKRTPGGNDVSHRSTTGGSCSTVGPFRGAWAW